MVKQYMEIPKNGKYTVQKGDEWAAPGKNDWEPADAMIGSVLDEWCFCDYRRPIPNPTNWQRVAQKMATELRKAEYGEGYQFNITRILSIYTNALKRSKK